MRASGLSVSCPFLRGYAWDGCLMADRAVECLSPRWGFAGIVADVPEADASVY